MLRKSSTVLYILCKVASQSGMRHWSVRHWCPLVALYGIAEKAHCWEEVTLDCARSRQTDWNSAWRPQRSRWSLANLIVISPYFSTFSILTLIPEDANPQFTLFTFIPQNASPKSPAHQLPKYSMRKYAEPFIMTETCVAQKGGWQYYACKLRLFCLISVALTAARV